MDTSKIIDAMREAMRYVPHDGESERNTREALEDGIAELTNEMPDQAIARKRDEHSKSEHGSEGQARAQLASIVEMVANLEPAECEFCGKWHRDGIHDRGPEESDEVESDTCARVLEDHESHDTEDNAREAAQQRIEEDVLSVEVRGDWHAPSASLDEQGGPCEFTILLCTGGPAVRIMGTLNEHGEPDAAWIEHQDWGTPWTRLRGTTAEEDEAMLDYSRVFYFGEG